MAIFLHEDVVKLLWNKFVVIIGDSIQRSIYKDLVSLLQTNTYLTEYQMKKKGELSFMDDVLIEGGKKEEMNNGINYKEVRQYKTDYHMVRVYNEYMESILEDLKQDPQPDVVLINSCLWDISRYGPNGMNVYKTNLEKTYHKMQKVLPVECLFIWNTALPVANKIHGGFLLPELEFLSDTLRLDVMEGNFYAKELAIAFEFDVLDLHYYFRCQLHRRVGDGVHWNHQAHRRISNLILTHVSEAWGLSVPRRLQQWQEFASIAIPQTPVNCIDDANGNFHTDVTLSAPPQGPRPRCNSVGDDWGNVNQFIDFDKVASPKIDPPVELIAEPNTTKKSSPVVGKNNTAKDTGFKFRPPEKKKYNGPMRAGPNYRPAQRYNPYNGVPFNGGYNQGYNNGGYQEGHGHWQGGQNQPVPKWRELEFRRKQRSEWERQKQFKFYGFQY